METNIKRLSLLACCILVVSALGVIVLANPGAKVRVGGESIFFNGQMTGSFNYSGSCPVKIKFDFGVISTEPTTVVYSFTRNDGGHTGQKSINIPKANHSVPIYDEWQLGANTAKFKPYKGWVELDITSPNTLKKKIQFTVNCQ